jgi:hypothetical protein
VQDLTITGKYDKIISLICIVGDNFPGIDTPASCEILDFEVKNDEKRS